jgi:CBS domain-containing protein
MAATKIEHQVQQAQIPETEPVSQVRAVGIQRQVLALMSWPAVVASPAMQAADALRLAHEHDVHQLPVVVGGDVLGVVCTCDLARATPDATVQSALVSSAALVLPASAPLEQAAELMDQRQVDAVITWWRDDFGIVTRGDLRRAGAASRACGACGAMRHVMRNTHDPDLGMCRDCAASDEDEFAALYTDLGGSG